ncbi:MAG: alpha amylase C-terminal domain-containing protein [Oligoflexales bacterium]|nr:alpha amylase C-terminal domain-containing protein [Oligoflexales bacterium]
MNMTLEFVKQDPYLTPYEGELYWRIERFRMKLGELTGKTGDLSNFALGYLYYGLQREKDGNWVMREWAPNATSITLVGDFSRWQEKPEFSFARINRQGDFELRIPGSVLKHGMNYNLKVRWHGGEGVRLPAYANYVVQDEKTKQFSGQVWAPEIPYQWKHRNFKRGNEPLLIYESHVGMAQEDEKVGTYLEFRDKTLPRIIKAGYNAIQFMALTEHPYYGSFGYQVSNFFAPSSRFGTPDELKALVDACHESGVTVIMDIVHSHAVRNEVEGISRQDGTLYQYFHDGGKGFHPAWDSRCFDYGKNEVLHFLLSNCRYWLDVFDVDGFRFDGVTSMLYWDRGHRAFDHYDHYFNEGVDKDAVRYLALANKLIHDFKPHAITIAEDMSGMPGMCLSPEDSGVGFDYRLAMGMPDLWIKIVKHKRYEDWNVEEIWNELINRRIDAKTICYSESHDQALVGDKTLIFHLIDKEMYWHMNIGSENMIIDKGIAQLKLIRLVTFAAGGEGYLNFMGNEFGHPQWIDFPREGNGWSYHWARRQWNLIDHKELRYHRIGNFDRDMVTLCKESLSHRYSSYVLSNVGDQVLAFSRGDLYYFFNFSLHNSYADYGIRVPIGDYELVISSDDVEYDGQGRVLKPQTYSTLNDDDPYNGWIRLYLPTQTALVLRKITKN